MIKPTPHLGEIWYFAAVDADTLENTSLQSYVLSVFEDELDSANSVVKYCWYDHCDKHFRIAEDYESDFHEMHTKIMPERLKT